MNDHADNATIRVMVVDDHYLVRKGVSALLDTSPGFTVVAEASNGVEAREQANVVLPDVILMDLGMPGGDGIQAIGEIREDLPNARILVLTSFTDDNKVFAAIKAGAQGYLLKDSLPNELLRAIEATHRGETSLHPAIAAKVIQELNKPVEGPITEEPLTEREISVLELVARGMSNKEISDALTISERTVTTHVSNILSKLQLANRTQAALYALREGLVNL